MPRSSGDDFDVLDAHHADFGARELEEPKALTIDSQDEFVDAVEFLAFDRDVSRCIWLGSGPDSLHYAESRPGPNAFRLRNQDLTPISHRLKLGPDGGFEEQAQQAPQSAAPVHREHHQGSHYALPHRRLGGRADFRLSPTTFSAYAATLSPTFCLRLLATVFAFATA